MLHIHGIVSLQSVIVLYKAHSSKEIFKIILVRCLGGSVILMFFSFLEIDNFICRAQGINGEDQCCHKEHRWVSKMA